MTVAPYMPALLRLVEYTSIGTDVSGNSYDHTVSTGLYANVVALAQAAFIEELGVDNLRLSDDFKLELYSTAGTTLDIGATLAATLGFSTQVVIGVASWETATYQPRYIWIPKHNPSDQRAFGWRSRDLIRGAESSNGTLAAYQVGSLTYDRNVTFIAEEADNLSKEFCTTDEDEYRTLQTFVLGACTASPSSTGIGNPRGFWWYPNINDAIADCTHQPYSNLWSTAGDIDFHKTVSASTKVFCHFDKERMISQWERSAFLPKSTLLYNADISFHTAPIPTLTSVTFPWPATFQALDYDPGVDQLEAEISFPGGDVTPAFRYKGGDADGTDLDAWTYGDTLSYQSSTNEPDYNWGSPWKRSASGNDDSVKFSGSGCGYYKAAGDFTDLTTGDIYFEALLYVESNASTEHIVSSAISSGFFCNKDAADDINFFINDGITQVSIELADNVGDRLVFVSACIDRNEASSYGAMGLYNGLNNQTGDLSSASSSLSGSPLSIGAKPNGTTKSSTAVLYAALYTSATLWDGGSANATDMAAIHNERFWKLCGIYPTLAQSGLKDPTYTRADCAYMESSYADDEKRRLWYVGEGMPRVTHWWDETNNQNIRGYLSEPQVTNIIQYSNDMSNWTEIDAGDTTTYQDSDWRAPDRQVECSSLIPDTDNGEHGWYCSETLTAMTYTFSVFVPYFSGATRFVKLSNDTLSNCYAYFDIQYGVIYKDDIGAGIASCNMSECTYTFDENSGGWLTKTGYRIWITFTGTAASHDLYIRASNDSETGPDDTFAGDGSTTKLVVWGAQCEAYDMPTSMIPTSGGTSSRTKDTLTYEAGDNIGGEDVGEGEFDVSVQTRNYNNTFSGRHIFALSDGASEANMVSVELTSGDKATVITAASAESAGEATNTVDITDSEQHDIEVTWGDDSLSVVVDGTAGTDDEDCGMPDDVDTITVGASPNSGYNQAPACLISDIEIRAPE